MVVKLVLWPGSLGPPRTASDTWDLPGPPISMGDPPAQAPDTHRRGRERANTSWCCNVAGLAQAREARRAAYQSK